MKIAEIHLYEYALPLKQPLIFGEKQLNQRCGYVIELRDENCCESFGEIAPLDGYSDESQTDVIHELLRLRRALVGSEIPANLEELSGGFENWLRDYKLSPSVRFGVESALLLLMAQHREVSLAQLLSNNPLGTIPVNALLTGSYDTVVSRVQNRLEAGYSTFKLKVGSGSIDDDIRLTREVHNLIGPNATLRLDANRRFNASGFEQFAQGVRGCDIDYIEEPLSTVSALKDTVKCEGTLMPIALDETLRTMTPEALHDWSGAKAIVLKPTILGLERSCRFARVALELNMDAVFSSSYETSLGLITIAQVAAAFNIAKTPIGLDTVGIFKKDLLSHSLAISDGQVAIGEFVDIAKSICRDQLEEIADA
jgi:o-succinylbenzoate synthase